MAKVANTKEAQKAEAVEATEVSFEYDGEKYSVPRDVLDDVNVHLWLEEGNVLKVLHYCLGPVQWKVFTQKKRTVSGDLTQMVDALFAAFGTTTGE